MDKHSFDLVAKTLESSFGLVAKIGWKWHWIEGTTRWTRFGLTGAWRRAKIRVEFFARE